MNKLPAFLLLFTMIASVYAVSGTNAPTSCSGWTSCSSAFADGSGSATATPQTGGMWSSYGFSLASSSIVSSVSVRADFFASRTNGYADIEVSDDGGLTWKTAHRIGGNTAEQTYNIDVTGDATWTPATVNDMQVRVTCVKVGTGGNPTCNLDYLPVTVTYTPFDFTLSANPPNGSAVQGASIQTTVGVTSTGGIAQPVTLSYAGCPTGATCYFDQSSGTPNFNSPFHVNTSGTTPAGDYLINITGTGDGKTHAAFYRLSVTAAPPAFDFAIALNPNFGITSANTNVTSAINVTLVSGSGVVNLSYSNCPAGVSCFIWPSSGSPDFTSTLYLMAGSNVTPGNYSVTVTGIGGSQTHSADYLLVVQ